MIGADDAERHPQDRGEQRHAGEHDDQAHDVAEIHAGDETPDEVLLLDEQQWSRLQAPDQQAAEQHGGGRRAGHAEREHRQQRRGAGGVRRGLRRHHAFDLALAEEFAAPGDALGDAVAHERGRRRARRADAHPAADQAGAQRGGPVGRQLFPGLPHHLRVDLRGVAAEAQALFHGQQDLADTEQADHRDQEVEAAQQFGEAERQTQLPGHLIEADRAERKADHHRGDGLERRLLAQADEAAEGEEIDREDFRRPELQREARHQRREQRDHDDGEQRADEGRGERGGQRLAGLALLRHRIAVERGRHRPWFARYVEQHRGDGAAEQRTPVDARQHDDRRRRRHAEGQRQQDGDAVGAAEPRQHADDDAERDAEHHQHDVVRLQHHGEAVKQIADIFDHVRTLTARANLPAAPWAAAPGTSARTE